MSIDFSRISFDPLKDYLGVIMQQGRVQIDADWNEAIAQISRRLQAETLDTFGQAVVPRETSDGFLITLGGGTLTIGAGRMYVDGLLVENHREALIEWYQALAEQRGTGQADYLNQPYYPTPEALPAAGSPYLVYLDVWQREVTRFQDPTLVEKAVGIDTTARMQTVWQVKFLDNIGSVTPATPEEDIPGWTERTFPSSGRLTTSTGDLPDEPNPCLLPPAAGYKGLENQLYRVEIHEGGIVGEATFKWSRDNATVMAQVTGIPDLTHIVVDSIGRDDVLRFHDGDWVEITDDVRELHNLPGEIRQIQLGGGVDSATRILSLAQPLTAGLFPVNAQNEPEQSRHTRVKRWDQSGMVRLADGSNFHDLQNPANNGAIPVPTGGVQLFLEDGILVSFDLEPTGEAFAGEFKSGDYWIFTARSVDASIEILDKAPPRGIHHHYAKLALVNNAGNVSDCRVLWPPKLDGESCDCSVCVHPEAHNAGTATIQQAIDQVAPLGGTVCLAPGVYQLQKPLRIQDAGSVRMRGQGWRTILQSKNSMSLIEIQDSTGIALENLSAINTSREQSRTPTVAVNNTAGLEISRCNFLNIAVGNATSVAIQLTGYVLFAKVQDSLLMAERGIEGPEHLKQYLGTGNLTVTGCAFLCSQRAISFEGMCFHLTQTRISHNLTISTQQASLFANGAVLPKGDFLIEHNSMFTQGTGIHVGLGQVRILSNDIYGPNDLGSQEGVALEEGLDPTGIQKLQIFGNRISSMGGHSIVVREAIRMAMIKQNQLEQIGGGGFVMEDGGSVEILALENNQFVQVNGVLGDSSSSLASVMLQAVERGDILNNIISDVVRSDAKVNIRVALVTVGCGALHISGNRIFGVGPVSFGGRTIGILNIGSSERVDINNNSVERFDDLVDDVSHSAWSTIFFGNPAPPSRTNRGLVTSIGKTLMVGLKESAVLLSPRLILSRKVRTESISVHNNHLIGDFSNTPFVTIQGAQSIFFSNNDCNGTTTSESVRGHVGISSDHANVSNNKIAGPIGKLETMQITAQRFVVMGNMSTGSILANGTVLPEPWNNLNILI